ncbi:hypothetical protein QYF36_026227 [Acer negundo]|nr:hypothetical protein QYF36_026227 [Acer negundo]
MIGEWSKKGGKEDRSGAHIGAGSLILSKETLGLPSSHHTRPLVQDGLSRKELRVDPPTSHIQQSSEGLEVVEVCMRNKGESKDEEIAVDRLRLVYGALQNMGRRTGCVREDLPTRHSMMTRKSNTRIQIEQGNMVSVIDEPSRVLGFSINVRMPRCWYCGGYGNPQSQCMSLLLFMKYELVLNVHKRDLNGIIESKEGGDDEKTRIACVVPRALCSVLFCVPMLFSCAAL